MCPDGTQCRLGSPDVPDATRCGAWVQDAQDAQDAESRLEESGCNTTVSDAGHLFADVEVSRMKRADTSGGRCPPESGRVSLQSARRGESNGIGFEASACL